MTSIMHSSERRHNDCKYKRLKFIDNGTYYEADNFGYGIGQYDCTSIWLGVLSDIWNQLWNML